MNFKVYNLDLNDLPLDRLSERAAKKRRGKQGPQETKYSNALIKNSMPPPTTPVQLQHDIEGTTTTTTSAITATTSSSSSSSMHPPRVSPYPRKRMDSSSSNRSHKGVPTTRHESRNKSRNKSFSY